MHNRPSISDYYRDAMKEIRGAILRESEEQIIGSSTDDLASYYYDGYALASIELDDANQASLDNGK